MGHIFSLDYTRGLAETLVEQGYILVPVSVQETGAINAAMESFIARRQHYDDASRWALHQRVEAEPERGLIFKSGQLGADGRPTDHKYYFHFDPRLPGDLERQGVQFEVGDKRLLHSCNEQYGHVFRIGQAIVRELDRLFAGVAASHEQCGREAVPGATSELRVLYYPNTPDQRGAQKHFDRSFITIHLGDVGGQLQALLPDGREVIISPPLGFAVVFFGVKVLWVSGGRVQPLLHWSTTGEARPRQAQVFFGHVQIPGYKVVSAWQARSDFTQLFLPAIKNSTYDWRTGFA